MKQPLLLKLLKIGLLGCQFRIGLGEENLGEENLGEEQINLAIYVYVEEGQLDRLKVFLDLILGIPNSEQPSKFLFDLRVIYGGEFFITSSKLDDETLKRIGAINAAAILYPYLRNFVSHLVLESLQIPFLLPPINFVEYYKKNPDNIYYEKIKTEKNTGQKSQKQSKRRRSKKT